MAIRCFSCTFHAFCDTIYSKFTFGHPDVLIVLDTMRPATRAISSCCSPTTLLRNDPHQSDAIRPDEFVFYFCGCLTLGPHDGYNKSFGLYPVSALLCWTRWLSYALWMFSTDPLPELCSARVEQLHSFHLKQVNTNQIEFQNYQS